MRIKDKRRRLRQVAAVLSLVAASVVTQSAMARTAAAPQSNSPPTISGQEREGRTLTANNGSWANNPSELRVPVAAVRPVRERLQPDLRRDVEDLSRSLG